MFQAREPQESLWQSEFLITPRKAKLMRRSWAEVFRNEALVLIEEERFAPMYSPDMGRPNRAVQTVLGVLVLKEMFDLTDMEALEELEFNLLWHHALRLEMEEAHLAQKTLHNFRVRLMEHDGGRLAFSETTDRMIAALGVRTGKQRLDSTHVMSNIAVLTRLGLFCETVRVFLLAVSREHPGLGEGIGATIFAGRRQLFLPVVLLLKTLLSCTGPIAGNVELQDDRVMDDPVYGRCRGHRVDEDLVPL